jgi:DNA-binding SARP family transcriptional activator
MSTLKIYLFRRFLIKKSGQSIEGLDSQKVKELLCYLLLNQQRPHTREKLSSLLWPSSNESQAKQYLRQTLWQLQSTLESELDDDVPLLLVETNWIQVNQTADYWVDVAEFEHLYNYVRGKEGSSLNGVEVEKIKLGITLYRGDFLENWYQDWCVFERERLQNIYLAMLDKLLGRCEALRTYEQGLMYAMQILQFDRAHERTYRRLMRLYYYAGDRTNALRQFVRCTTILLDELGVEPSRRTVTLYEQIKADRLSLKEELLEKHTSANLPNKTSGSSQADILIRLRRLKETLLHAQRQVEQEIDAVTRIPNNFDI